MARLERGYCSNCHMKACETTRSAVKTNADARCWYCHAELKAEQGKFAASA